MTRQPRLSRRSLIGAIAVPFLVVACGAASDSGGDPSPSAPAAAATDTAAAASEAPATAADTWRDIELTDAASGETFTLASLEGQPVAIEPFAVWCTNCKVQQDNVKAAFEDLEAAGLHYISLGVEPNESRDAIARYQERREYPWTFAQSPIELSRALNDLFGPQILSVPSTPLIILDETGEIVFQDFGYHDPDSLVELVNEAVSGTL